MSRKIIHLKTTSAKFIHSVLGPSVLNDTNHSLIHSQLPFLIEFWFMWINFWIILSAWLLCPKSHIYVSRNQINIGSGNGLVPVWLQAITWTNVALLLIRPLGKFFNETLQLHHSERDGISDHKPHDCLLNLLFRCRWKKTSKLCFTGICGGNSTVTGEFPAQRASNTEIFPFDDVIMF